MAFIDAIDAKTLVDEMAKQYPPALLAGLPPALVDEATAKLVPALAPLVDKALVDLLQGLTSLVHTLVDGRRLVGKIAGIDVDLTLK